MTEPARGVTNGRAVLLLEDNEARLIVRQVLDCAQSSAAFRRYRARPTRRLPPRDDRAQTLVEGGHALK